MSWHVCNKLSTNRHKLTYDAFEWLLFTVKEPGALREQLVSLHWCRARAVKWCKKLQNSSKYWTALSVTRHGVLSQVSLSQMDGKTGAAAEPHLGSMFNRRTDQHLQGKAMANTGSFRRHRQHQLLANQRWAFCSPEEKATTSAWIRHNFYFFRVTSHGQGRHQHGDAVRATLRSDWPGTDQRLPTTGDHTSEAGAFIPLTLHGVNAPGHEWTSHRVQLATTWRCGRLIRAS